MLRLLKHVFNISYPKPMLLWVGLVAAGVEKIKRARSDEIFWPLPVAEYLSFLYKATIRSSSFREQ